MKISVRKSGRIRAQLSSDIKNLTDMEVKQFLQQVAAGLELSTAPYVPVDTSALINSATRGPVKRRGEKLSITFGYGVPGGAKDYARFVHDGPQKNWQKAGASNRFLRKGARDFVRDILPALIKRFGR